MKIIQIAPVIGPGTGVGAVAHHLEAEWQLAGVSTLRFTLDDAHGGWLPEPGPGLGGKVALALRVVWFSTVGTVTARRFLGRHPGAVSVCHNDAVAGDIYVNHGIVQVAMRARGRYRMRMIRNPMHLFIATRDGLRYRGRAHRRVVNLVAAEEQALRATYPRLRPTTETIGNGVDVKRYQPPTQQQRLTARTNLGLGVHEVALLFLGHEYARKGLPLVLDALTLLPAHYHLVVVGGTSDMVDAVGRDAAALGVQARVHLAGAAADPTPFFHACDTLLLPSAYESYGLVVLEALACGVPVVATPTGCVCEVIVDGVNGYVTPADPRRIAEAVTALAGADREVLARAARESALQHSWSRVAQAYLAMLEGLHPAGGHAGPGHTEHHVEWDAEYDGERHVERDAEWDAALPGISGLDTTGPRATGLSTNELGTNELEPTGPRAVEAAAGPGDFTHSDAGPAGERAPGAATSATDTTSVTDAETRTR